MCRTLSNSSTWWRSRTGSRRKLRNRASPSRRVERKVAVSTSEARLFARGNARPLSVDERFPLWSKDHEI